MKNFRIWNSFVEVANSTECVRPLSLPLFRYLAIPSYEPFRLSVGLLLFFRFRPRTTTPPVRPPPHGHLPDRSLFLSDCIAANRRELASSELSRGSGIGVLG